MGKNLNLKAGQVHLWCQKLSYMPLDDEGKCLLDSHELERGERFIYEEHREKFFKSHIFLRKILARYLEQGASEIAYSYHVHGKPYLVNCELSFNLSHSEDYVFVGLCLNGSLGVDIEYHRARDFFGIAKHSFSVEEVALLEDLHDEQLMQRFYEIWSKKEAYIKYTGLGLRERLDAFFVSMADSPSSVIKDNIEQQQSMHYFEMDKSYSLAVCVEPNSTLIWPERQGSDE